jgi:hypothetical protein
MTKSSKPGAFGSSPVQPSPKHPWPKKAKGSRLLVNRVAALEHYDVVLGREHLAHLGRSLAGEHPADMAHCIANRLETISLNRILAPQSFKVHLVIVKTQSVSVSA